MQTKFSDAIVATEDPPENGINNPIHAKEGASAAGYAGALVTGVRTYGWAVETLTRALGERWLERGWIDYRLKRPLYAGETLLTEVEQDADCWKVTCSAGAGEQQRIVLEGTAGHDDAPWLEELNPPTPASAQERAETLPSYDLQSVPLRQPLRPLGAFVTPETARNMVSKDLGLDNPHYLNTDGEPGFIHPYFLAGRIAPLTRHNFTYGPTIHVRSQIQHRREAKSGQRITVGAQIVDAYDRNGHWYQVLDSILTDDLGELALIRHHSIFRPRGT